MPSSAASLSKDESEIILKIKEEVEKQLKAGFLTAIAYSNWAANIVLVPKKDGKVCMCIDYRDLNQASPKDNFPLLHIDILIDNTTTNKFFSLMERFQAIIRSSWLRRTKLDDIHRITFIHFILGVFFFYIYIYKGKEGKGSTLCSCTILFVFKNKVGQFIFT